MKKFNNVSLVISFVMSAIFYHPIYVNNGNDFANQAVVLSGNANRPLAEKIADQLQVPLCSAIISNFNDGEINIRILESIRGKHVFIIQSTCSNETHSINDNLMELILLIRTCKRASVQTITVVMPYYGYARQDRKSAPRVPISAADVAYLIEIAGADRILTVDLHCGQIQGFFRDIPVDNLYAAPTFISRLIEENLQNPVVVSPDAGGVERATKFLQQLENHNIHGEMAIISKQRANAGVIASMNLIGNVQGADAIIVDDMCDTAGTLIKAAQLLKDLGATRVFAVITHPVFSANAMEKIHNSVIDTIIIADTIPLRDEIPANITVVSISSLIAKAISHVYYGESVSKIFE